MQYQNKTSRPPAPAAMAKTSSAMHLPQSRNPQVRQAIVAVKKSIQARDFRQAGGLINQLLQIEPANPEVHFLAAVLSEAVGNMHQAVGAYRKVLELKPNFLPALVNSAAALADGKQPLDALDVYRKAYQVAPKEPAIRHNMASTLSSLKRFEEALVHRQWLARSTNAPLDIVEMAQAMDIAGKPAEAKATFAGLLKSDPNQPSIHVHIAFVDLMRGNPDAAAPALEKAIEIQPNDGHARLLRAKFYTGKIDVKAERDTVAGFLPPPANWPPYNRAALYNAFALLNEKLGDYDAAFQAFADGNAIVNKWQEKDAERRETVKLQTQQFTEWRHKHPGETGSTSDRPVFVTGMPRSGTTLVEQILSSHSQASGAGELELVPSLVNSLNPLGKARMEKAAQGYLDADAVRSTKARRIIDKSLSSWEVIGAILLMFPNARIIDCQRHPMDVCWSAYTELFNEDALIYTYDFERLADTYRRHEELVGHWLKEAPENVTRVRYEDIIANPDAEARRLVSHIGLDWEDGCLDFMNSNREVRTASMLQVRQPIYSSSVGKWKRYEKHLEPLAKLLEKEIRDYEKA